MTARLLFCGTPEFAVPSLEALHRSFEIVHVLSQPDRPAGRGHKLQASAVKRKALELGLSVSTPENINETSQIDFLKTLDLDAIVVVAYGQILKQPFLDLCPQKCVNLHGSCLPRWRGAAPIQRALMAGDTESGVSLQVVVRKLDAGPVIGERRVFLNREINAIELHDTLKALGVQLFQEEFPRFLRGEIEPRVQDESLVTVAEKIQKAEALLDWRQPATTLHNQVRGLALGPQATTRHLTHTFKIHRTRVSPQEHVWAAPGAVVDVQEDHFTVACGEGFLEVYEIQPESKKKIRVDEFLRGFRLSVGGQFGA